MLPVAFESFFEQSASTVRGFQKTYDQVVWGVESPPPYDKGKNDPPTTKQQQQKQTQQQKKLLYQPYGMTKQQPKQKKNRFFRTPTTTRGRTKNIRRRMIHRHSRPETSNTSNINNRNINNGKNVLGTPTTDADDSSEGESAASRPHSILESAASDPHSILEIDSPSDSSSIFESENDVALNRIALAPPSGRSRITPRWKYATDSKTKSKNNAFEKSSSSSPSNIHIKIKPESNNSSRRSKTKLQQKLGRSRSIDEIFGYNTKQSITKAKSSLDQDVGIDFMVLDIPSQTNSLKKRPLLIVRNIDRKGLFASTDLGVGDAVLSINGTSFADQVSPRYGNRSGPRGNSSGKPNLFQARALLNGRKRSVTIEYQKFGETNYSVCSSTLQQQQQQQEQQYIAAKSLALAHEQGQHPVSTSITSKPFASLAHSRRSSSNRVDFLGNIRTNTKSSPSSPKNGKKGKSSRFAKILTPFSDSESSTSSDVEYEEYQQHYQQQVEAPPRISRLNYDKENSPGTIHSNDKHGVFHTTTEAVTLPYRSVLNNGPEEQIQLLKQRVDSVQTSNRADNQSKAAAQSPARSTFSESKVSTCSPARSTRSESYLQELRKSLSPTANAILADLSVGMTDVSDAPQQPQQQVPADSIKKGKQLPPTNFVSDGNEGELVRINRKVFDKVYLRVEILKKNNMELKNELAALKENQVSNLQKLTQAQKQLDQNDNKEKAHLSQIELLQSRLDISTIQADKRHRELLESKEKSIADKLVVYCTVSV